MKPEHVLYTKSTAASHAHRRSERLPAGRLAAGASRLTSFAVALLFLAAGAAGWAQQSVRFTSTQVRVTVPVGPGSTNISILYSNLANLSTDLVSAVSFNISGLPAGTSYAITDDNGNPVPSTSNDTNLVITLNTTNIPEGLYPFYLNATTNGVNVNQMPFVLQSAHIWNGSLNTSNAWSTAVSWLNGVPGTTSDVVFGDKGSQTNVFPNGNIFTNITVDVNSTVGSVRFSQTGLTNAEASDTNNPPRYHHIRINPGLTLTVSGTNGFSLMHDYIDNWGISRGDRLFALGAVGVQVSGIGATLLVSNENANLGLLVGNQTTTSLNLTNLSTFVADVSRAGFGEFQLYPNYLGINAAINQGRGDTNYAGFPRNFTCNVTLARTNFIKAVYKDANDYTNEYTRGYGISYLDSEQQGNGSSVSGVNYFFLGATNGFFADGVCFIGANHALGNNGVFRFRTNNSTAYFRGTNGGRMSMFAVCDEGGTNEANSNMKGLIDFASGTLNGSVDILADRLYLCRDRTLISSNQTPTVEGDLIFGKGNVEANTAILGYQEHSGKSNWTAAPFGAQPYLDYCKGRLYVTNGGAFKVNRTLTLGFTADVANPTSSQPYNTYGQITIYSNSTVIASNIVIDGGANYYDSNGRQNSITMLQSFLTVTNGIGGSPGLPLDTLSMNGSTLTLASVNASTPVVNLRTLLTPGTAPSTLKVLSVAGVSSYPATVPVISYQGTAAPFLKADVTALGAGFVGYVLNDSGSSQVEIYITTNAPSSLVWRGNLGGGVWDSTTKNWVLASNPSLSTNFTLGDTVTFDDSASNFTVSVSGSVVPGQAGVGMTVNSTANYAFSSGGTIAGTFQLLKQGPSTLTMDAIEQGGIVVSAGTVTGGGQLGFTTVASNAVVNYNGIINGGLTSTGTVVMAGSLAGPISLYGGGSLDNQGSIDTAPGTIVMTDNSVLTNEASHTINVGGSWTPTIATTLANFGTINNKGGKLLFQGLFFGTGEVIDYDGTSGGVDGRTQMDSIPTALWSPGATPRNSIGRMHMGCRIDLSQGNPNNNAGTFLCEVDFANAQVNDQLYVDLWGSPLSIILMTNINPGAGTFASGQKFQVFLNTAGANFYNPIDTPSQYPLIMPPTPGPGLVWDISGFRNYGVIAITNTPLVWDGGSGTWDFTTANWKTSLIYTDWLGARFDDSASGTTTITLNTNVAPSGYNVISNIVTGSGGYTNIFTNGPGFSPGVVFSNSSKSYAIVGAGKLTGSTGLYKTGPGTLAIGTTNDFSGGVIIDGGGTLAISNVLALGLAATPNGNQRPAYVQVIIDGATLSYRYPGTFSTNINFGRTLTFRPGGATINVDSGPSELAIDQTALGAGALTKTGPSTLTLTQNGDTYAGGTTISAGALRLSAAAAGSGPINLANNTILQLTNTFTFTNAIIANATATMMVLGPNATNVSSGAWSGSGTVTISNAQLFVFNGLLTNFSGTLSFGNSVGQFRFNTTTNGNPCTGSALATFDLGTGSACLSNLNGGGLTYDLGALSGGPNTILAGRVTNNVAEPANLTYSIGANGANTTFSGKIVDGFDASSVVAVTKVGAGALLLNGINTYSGGTTVSNGVLGGSGSIAGPLVVQSGGTLSPGGSIGTFTVGGTVTLNGKVLMELNRANSPTKNDYLVAPSIIGGGTLVVTNIGPTIYNGSKFKLFSVPVSGFTTVTLPGAPYVWNNTLGSDGSIQLTTGGLPASTNVTVAYNAGGGTVTLSWPGAYLGQLLQSNSVSVVATNSWFAIPGSASVTQEILNVNLLKTNVFFRLNYSLP